MTLAGHHISGIHFVAVPALDRRQIDGPAPVNLEIDLEPENLPLESVSMLLDGLELYRGSDAPYGMMINTGELSDGLHRLTVRVVPHGLLPAFERQIPFEVSNTTIHLPLNEAVVKGDMLIDVAGHLPPEVVSSVHLRLVPLTEPDSAVTVWEGSSFPEPFTYDTRQLEDGRYRLLVESFTRAGAGSLAEVHLVVRNGWQLVDPLEAPQVFFGAVWDRSLTVRQSPGWVYATDAPDSFFGDVNRKLRRSATTEELVWEAPFLRQITAVLYAREADVAGTLEMGLSLDEEQWVTIPYEAAVLGKSETGWYRVQAVGTVADPDAVRYVRLRLLASSIPYDAIQIGEVRLEGR